MQTTDSAGAPRHGDGGEERPEKASFAEVYDAPTPQPYFTSLRPLDYRTPMHAQPVIRRILALLRRMHGRRPQVLDLCSGYGVNGALLKHGIGFGELYRRYADPRRTPSAEADRAALAPRRRADAPRVIGQDVATRALAYAEAVGFLDASIAADLESRPLSPDEARLLAETDLVTITGGLSYIGAATLSRALAPMRRAPWVLYFPLRGTPVEGIETALEEAGLARERWGRPFAHRRHADVRERRETLAALERAPADGLGPPSRTHLEAVLHLARPEAERDAAPLSTLVRGTPAHPRPDGRPAARI